MSATIKDAAAAQRTGGQEVIVREDKPASGKNYKGFVAGVFSGVAKLSGEYYACVS
jgi:solute carrier family 25 carnitine/acylcarnitine transporter 20/29